MSDTYVVKFYGFVFHTGYVRESRIESEPMTLGAAQQFHDHLAAWHLGRPVDFTLEPVIYKRIVNDGAITYEEHTA